ncbi:MAG: hypothetical protein ACO3TT_09950, partial [Candidatus Puniceispirillales bacterium]
ICGVIRHDAPSLPRMPDLCQRLSGLVKIQKKQPIGRLSVRPYPNLDIASTAWVTAKWVWVKSASVNASDG